jgi:hypothetical protein
MTSDFTNNTEESGLQFFQLQRVPGLVMLRDKNLDITKSRLKSLDFKNLNRDKKKFVLTVEKISTLFKSLSQEIEKS